MPNKNIERLEGVIKESGLYNFAWQYVDLTDDVEKEAMLEIALTELRQQILDAIDVDKKRLEKIIMDSYAMMDWSTAKVVDAIAKANPIKVKDGK